MEIETFIQIGKDKIEVFFSADYITIYIENLKISQWIYED